MSALPAVLKRRRLALPLAAAFLVSAGLATQVGTSNAAVLVQVPPGCGSLSGTMVSASRLDDHSNDASGLGDILAGTAHNVPANADMITVGTPFLDVIQGNAVNETICGLEGEDWIRGGSGDDDIFGGEDADSLWGEENVDLLSGGPGRDTLYGDDPGSTSGGFDGIDTLKGGDNNDTMFGGAGVDIIQGGNGPDTADGEANNATCTSVTNQTNC